MTLKYREKDCRLLSTTIWLLTIMLYASCTKGCLIEELPEKETAILRLHVESEKQANTSTRVAENDIKNIHVLIYNSSGELIGQKYATGKTVSISTRSATNCTVYAIANTGNPNLFNNYQIHSESYLKGMTRSISTWNELTTGAVIPMTGQLKNIRIVPGTQTLSGGLKVNRMAAKITLEVSTDENSEITITGYRIYGLPKRAYYVLRPLGTEGSAADTQAKRAEDATRVNVAADWTHSGNLSPTSSQSIKTTFYMLENRAGINTSITNQQNKTQANAPDSAAYILIQGRSPGYKFHSWRIYLGAPETANFNIKRNCTYKYNIILKRTKSDTRVTFQKKPVIWAGSNIYWNGSKLTFDETPAGDSDLKQGVYFKWGSIIGLPSASGAASGKCFVPSYNAASPKSSTWEYKAYTYDNIYCFDGLLTSPSNDRTNTFLNNLDHNSDAFYQTYKGDICRYLSKTGAVSGNWRMPTSEEWGSASDYTKQGKFELTTITNLNGTAIMGSYVTYTSIDDKARFPASGYFIIGGHAAGQGCHYWTASGFSNYTNSLNTEFGIEKTSPHISGRRTNGLTIRCVRYE